MGSVNIIGQDNYLELYQIYLSEEFGMVSALLLYNKEKSKHAVYLNLL